MLTPVHLLNRTLHRELDRFFPLSNSEIYLSVQIYQQLTYPVKKINVNSGKEYDFNVYSKINDYDRNLS